MIISAILLAIVPLSGSHDADLLSPRPTADRVLGTVTAGVGVATATCAASGVGLFVALSGPGLVACLPLGAVGGVTIASTVAEGFEHGGLGADALWHVGGILLGFVGGAVAVGAPAAFALYGTIDDAPELGSLFGAVGGGVIGGSLGAGAIAAVFAWNDLAPWRRRREELW
jgi:hypothetical protein